MRARVLLTAVLLVAAVTVGIIGLSSWLEPLPQSSIPIGGAFALTGPDGRVVTDKDFRGRWMIVYFGYTHCPDVCPATLSNLASALDKLPEAARAKVVPVFITVDPERDTPSVIGDYAHAFGANFVGLSGDRAAIGKVEQEYHVYAQKHKLKGGDYAMDHSSILYVMRPDGHFDSVLNDQMKPAEMAQRLQALGA